MESSINKVSILNRVLNNLGINDVEISKRIAEKITDLELKTFLLVFPIDGSEPISLKRARILLHLNEEDGNKNFKKITNAIFDETGIMLDERHAELIGLSEEDYEKYYFDVVGFFINRGFSNNDIILKIMRSVSVKYFKYFLEVFEDKKIGQIELAKKIGISEGYLSSRFGEIKEIIKEETGVEVFGRKRKNIQVKPIEEYKDEVKRYFKELGIDNESVLEILSESIKQVDFRVFVLKYPLNVETSCKREVIAETLDISFQMVKKSLEKVSDTFYEMGIPFSLIYKRYSIKYREKLFVRNNTQLEKHAK